MQTKSTSKQSETPKPKTFTQAFCESVQQDMRDSLRAGQPQLRALRSAISSAHAAATGWRVDEALFLAEAVTENVNAHAAALEIHKMILSLEPTTKPEPPAESADEESYRRALKEAAAFGSNRGLVCYRRDAGFFASVRSVSNTVWVGTPDCYEPWHYPLVRSEIERLLNPKNLGNP